MKYGRYGFRDNSKKIINFSYKIGKFVANKVLFENRNYGIMITGSNSLSLYNGIKIINYNGEEIDKEFKNELENFIQKDIELELVPELNSPKKIYIGNDTRFSFFEIKTKLIKGIKNISSNIRIVDLNNVTSPQHHYLTKYNYESTCKYLEKFNNLKYINLNLNNLVIDCANSISHLPLDNIKKNNKLNYKLINTNIFKNELLNFNCGSNYVLKNHKEAINCQENNQFYCSVNGDGTRFIFYYTNNGKIKILDGDYIGFLYLLAISKILKNNKEFTIGYLHTPLVNIAILDKIRELNPNINILCTNEKNLHKIAKNYDICVYFDSSGLGNLLINNEQLLDLKEFKEINYFNNEIASDCISGIFCVFYFLKYLNLEYSEWYSLLKKNKCLTYKKNIENINIFETNSVGDRLTKPIELQYKLDELKKKYNCSCLIYPSDSDNVITIYIESNNNIINIKKQIDSFLTIIK